MGIEIERKNIIYKIDRIAEWIREKVISAEKKGTIFGLSGGIDSAVIAALCKKVFPDNVMALILPCESNTLDIEDSLKVVNKYNINYKIIDLTAIYNQLLLIMETEGDKMAKANIKPRLRMIVLYYYASILDCLVVGTGNKSELSIGYFTKYGDGGVDILPLGNILKVEVRAMAEQLSVPKSIIEKPPTAGLWENQTDENEMGFSYAILDSFLKTGKVEDKEIENKILQMNRVSEHKRTRPPIPEI
ncbi:MAG: NAD(+) synthase [Candidatus Caldatribacteriota bacterium]|jgi:NAD+ synthase|nr:NAD(+) synthase [Atribacterota bacterium]MDD3641654.1 NAD(+) synthase [Atribacterota bacterium]MDD4288620.1 NAD(+) synthase [Atribacterota bacterium]MDD4765738.1 NAD(+) synthase [Atribacterota bacterium]MDI9596650.1 NAD(+) synthase [Atribacterota bacterium]